MDYVKKIICLEGARTRTQGLMPYYEFNTADNSRKTPTVNDKNGNWGQFVANPTFLGSDKTYEGMLHAYYGLLNMARNGVKLRKVNTKEGEVIFTEDLGAFEWNGQCFEGGEEPDFLYGNVDDRGVKTPNRDYATYDAKDFYSTDIESLREETRHIYRTNVSVSNDFVVLIDDIENFNKLASYLDGTGYSVLGSGINIGNNSDHLKWARYCQVVDICIGKINIPTRIFNKHIKVPKSMPCADLGDYIYWLENYQALSADCCNMRLWEDMGGQEMLDYLNTSASSECNKIANALAGLSYSVPYISMSLLLHQNYTDVGVLTNIDGVDYNDNLPGPITNATSRPHGTMSPNSNDEKSGFTQHDIDEIVKHGVGITIDQIKMGPSQKKTFPTTEEYKTNPTGKKPIEVESLLKTLRSPKKYLDDKNNVLPGLFKKFDNPAGKMFYCRKGSSEKFYKLEVTSRTVTEDGVTKTYWDVAYVETTASAGEIYGLNNLNASVLPSIPSAWKSLETQSEATAIVSEQQSTYHDVAQDAEYNPSIFMVRIASNDWIIEPAAGDPKDCLNGDGRDSSPVSEGGTRYPPGEYRNATGQFYRTITTTAAGVRIAETEEEETGEEAPLNSYYFFFVKYNNSASASGLMDIPYAVGNTANLHVILDGDGKRTNKYRGDVLTKISQTSEYIKFEYVVGGIFSLDDDGNYQNDVTGGDKYYEKYFIDSPHVDLVPLDGVDNVPVYSKYIDFEGSAKEFYSTRYNLYRTGNTANIVEMTTADFWNKDYAYDAYLAKEDYLTAFSLPPKTDVNVTIDRGGVSVFEKHYKLAECNTMQDLQNYHNGEFFPD